MREEVLNAVKKAIVETAQQSEFNSVHDCIVDFLEIVPTDEQVKKIILMLPSEIIGTAIKWSFNDTVVADNICKWLEENKERVLENI